jgi:hypothetical protein
VSGLQHGIIKVFDWSLETIKFIVATKIFCADCLFAWQAHNYYYVVEVADNLVHAGMALTKATVSIAEMQKHLFQAASSAACAVASAFGFSEAELSGFHRVMGHVFLALMTFQFFVYAKMWYHIGTFAVKGMYNGVLNLSTCLCRHVKLVLLCMAMSFTYLTILTHKYPQSKKHE